MYYEIQELVSNIPITKKKGKKKIRQIICMVPVPVPGAFSDKVIRDINFTDESVAQCHVPVVKYFCR